jgi:putative membrane protein
VILDRQEEPIMRGSHIALVCGLAVMLALAGTRVSLTADGPLSEDDREFLIEAASGGQTEVQLGRLASERARHARVKEFGRRMVTDHGKANAALKQLAAQKQVKLPAKPADDDHQKILAELSQQKGADFDHAYMQAMVEEHEDVVEEFRQAARDAQDADVKSFAAKALPTLEAHLRMAKEVASEVHATTSGAGKGASR